MGLDRDKSSKLMELAFFISQNSNMDVFVSYYPHVDGLDVRIYPDGWNVTNKEDVKKYNVRGNKMVSSLVCCEQLKDEYHYIDECIEYLQKVANSIPGFLKKE